MAADPLAVAPVLCYDVPGNTHQTLVKKLDRPGTRIRYRMRTNRNGMTRRHSGSFGQSTVDSTGKSEQLSSVTLAIRIAKSDLVMHAKPIGKAGRGKLQANS